MWLLYNFKSKMFWHCRIKNESKTKEVAVALPTNTEDEMVEVIAGILIRYS